MHTYSILNKTNKVSLVRVLSSDQYVRKHHLAEKKKNSGAPLLHKILKLQRNPSNRKYMYIDILQMNTFMCFSSEYSFLMF